MKNTVVVTGIFTALLLGPLGCKTGPKMPTMSWFKSAKAEQETKVAGPPQLPSDAARQAAGAAQSTAMTDAAPFVSQQSQQLVRSSTAGLPAAPGTGYPTTSAPPFSAESAAAVARSSTPRSAMQDGSAHLGSIAMPYDPQKTPTAPVSANIAAASAAPPADAAPRYGAPPAYSTSVAGAASTSPSYGTMPGGPVYSAPAYGSAAGSTTPPQTSSVGMMAGGAPGYSNSITGAAADSRYGAPAIGGTAAAAGAGLYSAADRYAGAAQSTASSAQTGVQNGLGALGASAKSAYGAAASAAQGSYNTAESAVGAAANPNNYAADRYFNVGANVQPASTATAPSTTRSAAVAAVAAAPGKVYRPGGTGTYPSGADVKVASLPRAAAKSSSVPNVAIPGGAPSSATQDSATRYR